MGFSLIFPLADSYIRDIRYIRYNLELKMDLTIRNVVYLEFMDRVKQIRIPHPLPLRKQRKTVLWTRKKLHNHAETPHRSVWRSFMHASNIFNNVDKIEFSSHTT